jgi:cytochrome P450
MTSNPVTDQNLLSPELTANPFDYFATLREHDPVHWSERHRGWMLTRYFHITPALVDTRLSSDRVRPLLSALSPERREHLGGMLDLIADWMVVNDPPEHTRLRKLANAAFKAQQVAAMSEDIQTLVDELLDTFIGEGHTDLVEHFAYPLPAIVIAKMLGAPPEDRNAFREWSDELALVAFGGGGDTRADRHERAMRGLEELLAYFRNLIERTRRSPGKDMLSIWIAGDEDDRLTDEELTAMCALMLFAGHETTTNLIANGTLALLQQPEQLRALREQPERINTAVEELLRFTGPIKTLIRWVSEDLEIGGQHIRKGDRVFLALASANHDPERFQHPEELDTTRSPNPHMAFGRGRHACIGAQLARIEARTALSTLLRRLPGLRLAAGEPPRTPSFSSHALAELPIAHDSKPR